MLTERQLVSLRADLEALLNDTVTVQRATATSDGAGGQTLAWVPVATVRGMVAPSHLRPAEVVLADRPAVVQVWRLSVPWSTDIRAGDRAVIGSRTFEVLAVTSGTYMYLKRVLVVEVT